MATYYIDPAGSDAAAGTPAAPWATLSHAAATAADGSTVHMAAGAYTEVASILISGKSLTVVPDGVVTIDCTAVNDGSPCLSLVNSGTVIQGTAVNTLTLGDPAGVAGVGGAGHIVQIVGSVSASVYARLYYVNGFKNTGATGRGVYVTTAEGATVTRAWLEHCDFGYTRSDVYSAQQGVAGTVRADFLNCVARYGGQAQSSGGGDGLTAHVNCTVTTQGCEVHHCDSGIAPANGCSWDSLDDYLHDNDAAGGTLDRQSNLFLSGGSNFRATGLRLGGTQTRHIYATDPCQAGTFTTRLELPVFSGTVTNLVLLGDGNTPAGTQNLVITGAIGTVTTTSHAIDDTGVTSGVIALTVRNSFLTVTTGAWQAILTSRASKPTTFLVDNCRLVNPILNGYGVYLIDAANDCIIRNTIISASYYGIHDNPTVAYGSSSGYNVVTAATAFSNCTAKSTDVTGAASLELDGTPSLNGNCDETGQPGLSVVDIRGRLRHPTLPSRGPVERWNNKTLATTHGVVLPVVRKV
jgi:hypothetical protein